MAGGRVNSVMRPCHQCTGGLPPPWNQHNSPPVIHMFARLWRRTPLSRMLRHMAWTGALLLLTTLLPSPVPGGPRWQWPLRPPPRVLRGFDPPAHPWEAGHRGVDLAARPGQPVYAAGPGRVTYARDLAGRGVVTVVHGTLRTTYLPVKPSVRTGQVVAAGARLGVLEGVLGHCGQSSCLHWGLLRGVSYLDPLTLLGQGPVRLLPWWGVHGPHAAGAPRDVPALPPAGPRRPLPGVPPASPPVRPGAR
ncbi:MAG: peptidase family, partial [Actinoallomurus sp.]|nr:peptidase family [Actinoallomurus sp.]